MKTSPAALFSVFLLAVVLLQSPAFAEKKAFVVYLGAHNHENSEAAALAEEAITNSHLDILASVVGSKERAKDAIFYSYTYSINGFAAKLEEDEAKIISEHPNVVSVMENKAYELHTTRSWDFLGLEKGSRVPDVSLWKKARFGEDTIIATLDTGVWPESESFNDKGMGPIPSRWKGACVKDHGKPFPCNRKLIGAKYFNEGYKAGGGTSKGIDGADSPRDTEGHGTHTLSTAGGSFVPGASVFGYGEGVAKGGSPRARVASYKVCWPETPDGAGGCYSSDILAAIDSAIRDGVDVLSLSIGGGSEDLFSDGTSIGAFHALRHGVSVVASAGNAGPDASTTSNNAPWIFTVAASTMDRKFPAYVSFDGKQIMGESLSTKTLNSSSYEMISGRDANAHNATESDAELCMAGSLDTKKVKGKIVVCLRGTNGRVEKGLVVLKAGGAGMVLANDVTTGDEIIADAHVLPATQITYANGLILAAYLNSTKAPKGFISKPKTAIGTKPAPVMTAFSSVGPNSIAPEILKPDITAPGLSVIAAYSMAPSPADLPGDRRRTPFNSLSGTSMSCPHVSGIVGLLKTLHPEWSPSMIRSAIMTTAIVRDNTMAPLSNSTGQAAGPFNYGAGHVHPNRAADPGLVYDATVDDYLEFLCAVGLKPEAMKKFSRVFRCPPEPTRMEYLNYPSIAVPNLDGTATVRRTLTNVGRPGKYRARFVGPPGVSVTVSPATLRFKSFGEKRTFNVTFAAEGGRAGPEDYASGWLKWSDGKHQVRSSMVVKAKSAAH